MILGTSQNFPESPVATHDTYAVRTANLLWYTHTNPNVHAFQCALVRVKNVMSHWQMLGNYHTFSRDREMSLAQ